MAPVKAKAKRPQNRTKTGTFQKGKSGNPGGRPKLEGEVRELARAHTKTAVERLAFWMTSDNAKASVSACSALLDRGWGKAPQSLHLEGQIQVPIFADNVDIDTGGAR